MGEYFPYKCWGIGLLRGTIKFLTHTQRPFAASGTSFFVVGEERRESSCSPFVVDDLADAIENLFVVRLHLHWIRTLTEHQK